MGSTNDDIHPPGTEQQLAAFTELLAIAIANAQSRAELEQLRVEVGDDGVGGAESGRGSGLTGLFDRVEARGGQLQVSSPPGSGTVVRANLPVGDPPPFVPVLPG